MPGPKIILMTFFFYRDLINNYSIFTICPALSSYYTGEGSKMTYYSGNLKKIAHNIDANDNGHEFWKDWRWQTETCRQGYPDP